MSNESEPRKSVLQRLWSVVDPNERYLRSIQPLVDQIDALEAEYEQYTQRDLQDRLRKIRSEVQQAKEAVEAAQADLPPAEDSDARRKRHEEIIAAEKAVLDKHLTHVFAAVREAAKRTLSMRPFSVQLMGGIVLHEGRIAEMKTGEGKTLTATCPLVLNALASRGSHVVTVNDYLARRDAEWMGKIYRYLGLSVGVIQHDMSREDRQYAYNCDITYITNHEVGFDYLRDHSSVWRPEHLVLRPLHYAIIDEVDSILIDEARVPLIISASRGKPVEKYRKVQEVVSRLELGGQDLETKETWGDLYIDEKAKNATLTEEGQRKVEIALGIDNLNDSAHIEDNHLANAALKANFVYKRDVDYIVGPSDGGVIGVIIVDTFTGRPQPGRRWSDGLHQAIEAKERVQIQDEQQTIATVTYQNFFLMYNRLSGMTGTAKTEEGEFVEIYEMPVVVVPTNRPMRRTEHPDVVWKSQEWKYRGICAEIAKYYCRRQPVLVGTRSVETSELISARLTPQMMRLNLQALLLQTHIMEHEKKIDKELLRQIRTDSTIPLEALKPKDMAGFMTSLGLDPELTSDANQALLMELLELDDPQALRDVLQHGVPHEVLNARHHEREAQIVAQAGRLGAVTIATNMAGRGTDIVLGGNPEPDVEDLLAERGVDPKSLEATLFINQALRGDADQARALAASHGHLPEAVLAEIAAIRDAWSSEHHDVLATGGLHILGTERLESRRIDNQLRGRSGRQGDPGSSRFYISLEDELMRLFGPDRFKLLMNQWPEEQPVEANMITKAMNNAQKKVEGRNYEIRKNTLRYDDVMNVQRKHIYGERKMILEGVDLRATVSAMMRDLVQEAIDTHLPVDLQPDEWDLPTLWRQMNERFPIKDQLTYEDLLGLDREALSERLLSATERAYDDKENDFIRAVVELELVEFIHFLLQTAPNRQALVEQLNAHWPLADYLPDRLKDVPDGRLAQTLQTVAMEAMDNRPRAFILEAVRDRLVSTAEEAAQDLVDGAEPADVAAWLASLWPAQIGAEKLTTLGDEPAAAIEALLAEALDVQGWDFARGALELQLAASVAATVPEHCDLPALIEELLDLWPLGEAVTVDALADHNYAIIHGRIHAAGETALQQLGNDFIAEAAEHRLRRLAAADAAGLPDVDGQARMVLGGDGHDLSDIGDPDALVERLAATAEDALILSAIEAVAVKEVTDGHRAMSLGAEQEDGDDEDELAFGDLSRLIEKLNRTWAFGEALDPWQLERVAPNLVRGEMSDRARGEIRTRGMAFVQQSSQLRLRVMVEEAIYEHYSLSGLCARLNRELELPAIFVPESFADYAPGPELVAVLTETAADVLEGEPERLEAVPQIVQAAVFENLNAKRLCDRLNETLKPSTKLQPKDLAGVTDEDLVPTIFELLGDDLEERFEEAFILDAVGQFLRLTIDAAFERYYDLRAVSAALSAAWPVRPSAVAHTRLKESEYSHLQDKVGGLLRDAYAQESWRFVRSFALKMLAAGMDEALAEHAPAGTPPSRWDLAGLAEELNQRWPLTEPLTVRELPNLSHALLVDTLMGRARKAYGEAERAFVRRTARHRFANLLEGVRQKHYSLQTAAEVVARRWGLGDAIQPEALAAARAALDDPRQFEAVVDKLVEPVLAKAQESFLRQAVLHRIVRSVDDVLSQHYNPGLLGGQLFGDWPLSGGGLHGGVLRSLPFRDMAAEVRNYVLRASGALRRRVVYHNLRRTPEIVDPAPFLPSGDPDAWRFGALAEALDPHLPLRHLANASQLAGDVVERLLRKEVREAASRVQPTEQQAVGTMVADTAATDLDAVLAAERRPSQVVARLTERWPIAGKLDAAELRGKSVSQVTDALLKAVRDAYAAKPAEFIAQMSALWLQRTIDEAMLAHWPDEDRTGPWDLSQVVQALNTRWQLDEGIHPTQLKGLGRSDVQAWLVNYAKGIDTATVAQLCIRELAIEHLTAATRAAAASAVEGETFAAETFAEALAKAWPGQAPSLQTAAGRLDAAVLRQMIADRLATFEGRVVSEYETETVAQWLEARVEQAMETSCSLTRTARELAQRWPVGELDTAPLATLDFSATRQSLLEQLQRAAVEGGDTFVLQSARQALRADLDQSSAEEILSRWPLAAKADAASEQLATAAQALSEAELAQAFYHETVRMRLRQAVDEAQREHANPEIAVDRWRLDEFVAALEKSWPIQGKLSETSLAGQNAEQVYDTAAGLLVQTFTNDPDGFIKATSRQQLGNTIDAALREHASLSRLAAEVQSGWPREEIFEPEALAAMRPEAAAAALVRHGQDIGSERAAELVGPFVGNGRADLVGLAKMFADQLGGEPLGPDALDEVMYSGVLQLRLEHSFEEDPHAFVKAVELEEVPRRLERRLMLQAIDTNWCDHLEAMDYLREGINLRGYGQVDPFIAYRKDGRQMFDNMLHRIRETVVSGLFETTEQQIRAMHSQGRLSLARFVEFQNVQEQAAKAEDLTGSQGPASQPGESGAARRRDERKRRREQQQAAAEVETSNIRRLRRGG